MEHTIVSESHEQSCASDVEHGADQSKDVQEIIISFYENEVPSFVEAEMERLYENVYTSLARFHIYGEAENASAYVVRKDGKVIAAFVFRREQKKVKVLNQQIRIEEAEIRRFANAVFARFKSVTVISFGAVQSAIRRFPFPYQKCHCMGDIVVTLPDTTEKYLTRLSKHMRRDVKYYRKKIERNFPSFYFQICLGKDVSEQHIRDIIRLSGARMAVKNKEAYISEEEAERIIRLAKVYGFVGVATIEGRVCAGTISYCVGSHYFMHVIAHDPTYDDYRLGTLCNYLTICECITHGGTEFRLMESSHRYKFDFLGARLDFDYLAIYRSRAHVLLDGGRVSQMAVKTAMRRIRLWFLDAERRTGSASRIAAWYVRALRYLKRSINQFLAARK
jgi:hypothetical protein